MQKPAKPETPAAEPVQEPAQPEEPAAEPSGSDEPVITKTLKIGESWSGTVENETPTILQLKTGKSLKVFMVVEGKKAYAAVRRADRPEDNPPKKATDPETDCVVVSWDTETTEYLVFLGADEGKKETEVSVTFLDEEAYTAWEAQSQAPAENGQPTAEPVVDTPAAETPVAETPAENPAPEQPEEEPFEEYNESEQTAVKLPASLLPSINDGGIASNSSSSVSITSGYYPEVSKPTIYISWTDEKINLTSSISFRLERRTDGGSWKTVATRKGSSYLPAGSNKGRFEYYDYNFTKGHVYEYRVRTIKSGKVTATSALSRVSALQMSKVSVTRTSVNYPKLTWTKVSNASGYYIFRKLSSATSYSSKPYRTVIASTLTLTDTEVVNGKTYNYLVVPFRTVQSIRYPGTYSNAVSHFAGLKAPVISKITQNNAGVTVTWKAVSGAAQYQVYVKKSGASSWSLAGTVTGKTTYTHSSSITTGTSGRYDQYCVRAVGKLGTTTIKSSTSSASRIYRLSSPGTVKLSNTPTKKKNGVTVSWSKVNGADKYYVYYRKSSDSSYTRTETTGTGVVLAMTGGVEYSVYVIASGKGINSQRTAIATITPPRYFALIIGNGTGYQYLNRLSGISNDVKAMKNALLGTCQNWKITVRENRTAAQIKSDITSAFKGATKSTDVCLFYYSGHGDNGTGSSAGSLCGTDYYYGSGAVSPTELRNTLTKATKGKVIVILDSCGSGAPIYANGAKPSKGSPKTIPGIVQNANSNPKNFTTRVMSAFRNSGEISIVSNTGELRTSKFTVLAACAYGKTSSGAYITSSSVNNWLDGNGGPFLSGSEFTYALIRTMGCGYPSGSYSGKLSKDTNGDRWLSLKETYNGVNSYVNSMRKLWYNTWDDYNLGYYNDADLRYIFDQSVQMYGSSGFGLFAY